MSARLDPTRFAGALADEHTDVPPHMTLTAWRADRHPARRPAPRRRWPRRLLRRRRRR